MHVPVVEPVDAGVNAHAPSVPPDWHDTYVVYVAHVALAMQVVPSEIHPTNAAVHSLDLVFFVSEHVLSLHALAVASHVHALRVSFSTQPA